MGSLIDDWAAATGREPDPDEFAYTEATKRRYKITGPKTEPRKNPVAVGDLTAALASCPTAGFPTGYRGRRDAALLVAVAPVELGGCGLTRKQARAVTGVELPRLWQAAGLHQNPRTCPRCAINRWAALLATSTKWGRGVIRDFLNAPGPPGHVCASGPPAGDLTRWFAFCHIDQYGWCTDYKPMSGRAVTAVVAKHATAPPVVDPEPTRLPVERGHAAEAIADLDEMADMIDAVCDEADRINARVAAALEKTFGPKI